jgi:nucleoside-diphosphate-sugar epimerase
MPIFWPVMRKVLALRCLTRISINSLVKKIRDLIGSNVESVHKQERGCDVRHSYADISKAQVILGYKPMVDLDSGLGITIEWFKTRAVSLLSYSSR